MYAIENRRLQPRAAVYLERAEKGSVGPPSSPEGIFPLGSRAGSSHGALRASHGQNRNAPPLLSVGRLAPLERECVYTLGRLGGPMSGSLDSI
jgi:hypothetical protein